MTKYTQFLIEEQLKKLPITKFFLGGSRAFGWENKGSDWDYVVFPSNGVNNFSSHCQDQEWKRVDSQGYYYGSFELDPVTFSILEKKLDNEKVQLQIVNKNGYLIKKVVLRYIQELHNVDKHHILYKLRDSKKYRGKVWKHLITETLKVYKEMKIENRKTLDTQ